MLASLADAPLDDPALAYEPKYDGIRAIAEVGPREVHLWSRLGNEKTNQFPEIVRALEKWARRLDEPVVLDGEIVALDDKGEPAPGGTAVSIRHGARCACAARREPPQSRASFAPRPLGAHDAAPSDHPPAAGRLCYVGHSATGYKKRELSIGDADV